MGRLTWLLDQLHFLHWTRTESRAQVCTQDTMLRVQQELYQYSSIHKLRCIVGLDLQKAFDTVHHSAILKQLQRLTPSSHIYNYIHNYRTTRRHAIRLPTYSKPYWTPSRGVPQGSFPSLLFFNIALRPLPLLPLGYTQTP